MELRLFAPSARAASYLPGPSHREPDRVRDGLWPPVTNGCSNSTICLIRCSYFVGFGDNPRPLENVFGNVSASCRCHVAWLTRPHLSQPEHIANFHCWWLLIVHPVEGSSSTTTRCHYWTLATGVTIVYHWSWTDYSHSSNLTTINPRQLTNHLWSLPTFTVTNNWPSIDYHQPVSNTVVTIVGGRCPRLSPMFPDVPRWSLFMNHQLKDTWPSITRYLTINQPVTCPVTSYFPPWLTINFDI